ncbi:hypothetical protein evm_000181, partial [Chilo suppressalis]
IKPEQTAKFTFIIMNDTKEDDMLIVGFQLAHPQPQFKMNKHPYIIGQDPHILTKKSSVKDEISIRFKVDDFGTYEMPIMFTFLRMRDEKNLIFVRELMVIVQDQPPASYEKILSPYRDNFWTKAENFIHSINNVPIQSTFKIPKTLKVILPRGLDESALEGLGLPRNEFDKLRLILIDTRAIMDEGITKDNYMIYFHTLLWWEEIIAKINLRKYNMSGVSLMKDSKLGYLLEVPGLSEKRPSLMRGDRVYLRPKDDETILFESIVKDLEDDKARLGDFDESFLNYYTEAAVFDVRFIMSRVPMERMHEAVSRLFSAKQECRVFPEPNKQKFAAHPITSYYNRLIERNEEQRAAVEHIVSGTSGFAPYIVFGPPGTGKTMTIVEAIVQLVVKKARHRILVCTDSNMAADHIALMLLKFNKQLKISNFLFRANSQNREWSVMPTELHPVSNGTNYENFYSVNNEMMASYRIVVTTLSHAAKYSSRRNQQVHKLQMSHLFIDEAAQASEPAALIPITGLLAPNGRLVLAGDPKQLGPMCISREAHNRGLGKSLLQRLLETYSNLYQNNPRYIMMLVKNFRSDPDILKLPNSLFYDDNLQALAKPDALSKINILGRPGGERAVIFHGVNSAEQRMGKAPSYFNEMELDVLKVYIKVLTDNHKVLPEDIGVIAPYIRQVYKIKAWLTGVKLDKIDVGTVEAFQGKEKRVILVSTVRANCKLLDYDAKYALGFLVDDKRFNVALTRAKAKIVIVGNPACLTRDIKWRRYIDLCDEYDCYLGKESQQLERNSKMLIEIARTRFDKCRLTDELKKAAKNNDKK